MTAPQMGGLLDHSSIIVSAGASERAPTLIAGGGASSAIVACALGEAGGGDGR